MPTDPSEAQGRLLDLLSTEVDELALMLAPAARRRTPLKPARTCVGERELGPVEEEIDRMARRVEELTRAVLELAGEVQS